VWVGYAVYGLAFALPWSLLGVGGQVIILASILGVTGIPLTEAQAIRSKDDAYTGLPGARVAVHPPATSLAITRSVHSTHEAAVSTTTAPATISQHCGVS
jgi:hypothetical protein